MNILYISKLTGDLWAGPNNSVPAQVLAQSKVDNVFWYNVNNIKRKEWEGLCHNLNDYPSERLSDLPIPFQSPDIAIIQGIYNHPYSRIIQNLQVADIPYILIPRSALTKQAQLQKPLKKYMGNLVYFNHMVGKASAIQYLTDQEKTDSGDHWNCNSFVIPNGINMPFKIKKSFHSNKLILSYIGRIDIYQKGLDLLLEVCKELKNELMEGCCVVRLYGPNQGKALQKLKVLVSKYELEHIIEFYDSVFGIDKEEVLLESDVFIMTSRFEGHSMGMIEALSYGLPCLATTGTNLSDVITSYDAGWAAGNNIASIKNAIRKMLSERVLLTKKGENAVCLASAYSWDAIAQSSHETFKKVIEEKIRK